MDRKAVFAALLPVLMLHACDGGVEPPAPDRVAGAAPSSSLEAVSTAPSPAAPRAADAAPPALVPEAEKGVKGARNILLGFASAIENKRFDRAWAMLGPLDREKWSQAQFARNFADLDDITVAIPEGESDAGAGSVFYIAPVTITATDADGRPVRYEGEARLRRVNDIDGATPEQLRWHFERLTLDWTH